MCRTTEIPQMYKLIPPTKVYKQFFFGTCAALIVLFSISLIQNFIRYGENPTYDIWKSVSYLIISILLFIPFITSVLKLLKDTYHKNAPIYWLSAVFLTVLTLLVFYLFSGVLLHLLDYFDHYVDATYARQYFGREAMYHLLILAATATYVHHHESKGSTKMISGSVGRKEINVNANQVNWIEADDHYLNVYTQDQTIIKRATMAQVSKELEPEFVRIHRKYLVNQKKIVAKEREQRNEFVVLSSGERLKVGKSYRNNLGTEAWVEV